MPKAIAARSILALPLPAPLVVLFAIIGEPNHERLHVAVVGAHEAVLPVPHEIFVWIVVARDALRSANPWRVAAFEAINKKRLHDSPVLSQTALKLSFFLSAF